MSKTGSSTLAWLDDLSEGVVLVDHGKVVLMNQAAATLLDVNPEQVTSLPLIAVLRDHRLEQAFIQQRTMDIATRGRILRVKPIRNGLSLLDVTASKRSQEGVRELLGVLSHELRTPVTTIRATLEALRYDLPAEQRERFLSRAEAESTRLVRLLEDLTVDVKPPRYRRVFVPDVVNRALSLLQRTFEKHNITLQQSVTDITVWADEDKLLQVLINLLENAAIHGPDDASICLNVGMSADIPGHAAITVRDYGTPLSDETIERLFEPHTRGKTSTQGSGLGLYIVRSIAERWGGHAWGKPYEHGNEFGVSVLIKG